MLDFFTYALKIASYKLNFKLDVNSPRERNLLKGKSRLFPY